MRQYWSIFWNQALIVAWGEIFQVRLSSIPKKKNHMRSSQTQFSSLAWNLIRLLGTAFHNLTFYAVRINIVKVAFFLLQFILLKKVGMWSKQWNSSIISCFLILHLGIFACLFLNLILNLNKFVLRCLYNFQRFAWFSWY